MTYIVVLLTLLFSSPTATPVQSQTSAALIMLRASNPNVQWDAKSAATADITCDGIADVFVVGYDNTSVWLALVPGLKDGNLAKPIVAQFPIDAGVQNGFCAKPVRIEVEPLDCEGESAPLPGCKPTKGASSFSLVDDACDSFHFYWDSERKELLWWRL
jgi:hypothetical protein